MTTDDFQKVEALVQGMETRIEQRLSECLPPAKKPTPKGVPLASWRGVAVILGVLTGVAAPVLAVTWYAADRMADIEDVQGDLEKTNQDVLGVKASVIDVQKNVSHEMAAFRQTVSTNITGLREEVQRLREAFAAYTRTILPFVSWPTPVPVPTPVP